MYAELLDEFHGRRVVEFDDSSAWEGPHVAYRLRVDYDSKVTMGEKIATLLDQPDSDKLSALIVGAWSQVCEGEDGAKVIADLVEFAPRLPGLRYLFLGEMTYEECEISWIKQSDVCPILNAYPKLEALRVRGGDGLAFSRVRHESLKELAIETGGLPRSAIRELFLCDFPSLEHLELLLGEENYGFDGGVEDLQPLLAGKLFPRLKVLGLMNSEIANDIAAVIVNAPIVARLDTLDLSMGNLDSEGVRSLLGLAAYPQLKQLNISHHFASTDAIDALIKALPCHVIAEDPQELEDDWRPILHAE